MACAAAANRSARDDSIIGSTPIVVITRLRVVGAGALESSADLHRDFSARDGGVENPLLAICRSREVAHRELMLDIAADALSAVRPDLARRTWRDPGARSLHVLVNAAR
jgi:hypothetical protein